MLENKSLKSDITLHWVIIYLMLFILIGYNIACHVLGSEIQINITEDRRVLIRSIFYVFAITLFPLVNLIRHILLRLNQTMPGDNPAKNRYFITTTVTLLLIESVGILGFIMFILGDEFNTLYIFTTLAVLGLFLHRPKEEEYRQIIEALRIKNL